MLAGLGEGGVLIRLTHPVRGILRVMDAIPYDRPIAFLRYLHGQRFCDREIAEYLNDPRSYLLHLHPHAPPPEQPGRWTRRMVRRWRAKLGLKAHPLVRRDLDHPAEARVIGRRAYAARWSALGLDLYPAQVDILDALHGHGRHTMRELMARHGWSRPPTLHGTRSAVARLVEAGAVVIAADVPEGGRLVRQYALAEGVAPRGERRRLTGVEQRLKDLKLIEDTKGRLPYPTGAPHTSGAEKILGGGCN